MLCIVSCVYLVFRDEGYKYNFHAKCFTLYRMDILLAPCVFFNNFGLTDITNVTVILSSRIRFKEEYLENQARDSCPLWIIHIVLYILRPFARFFIYSQNTPLIWKHVPCKTANVIKFRKRKIITVDEPVRSSQHRENAEYSKQGNENLSKHRALETSRLAGNILVSSPVAGGDKV